VTLAATLTGLAAGKSAGGELVDSGGTGIDVATLLDDTHNQLRIAVNGQEPISVQIAVPGDLGTGNSRARLTALCNAIAGKVTAQVSGHPELTGFTCARENDHILMTSGAAGEHSRVRVLPGTRNDATARLKLGTLNGGTETDGVAAIRPKETPDRGFLRSDAFGATDLDALPNATHTSLVLTLDGGAPDTVSLGAAGAAGTTPAAKLADVAKRIQDAVRALRASTPAYRDFTCEVNTGGNRLVLTSGTRGAGSSVLVTPAASNSIADELHLLTGTTATPGANFMLQGGTESPFTDAEAYSLFIASRAQRKGIFALDAAEIINLLCLPGVADAGILADAAAYCEERRAFLIVDAPRSKKDPQDMAQEISGPALPKTRNGAIYYPWQRIGDPLQNGRLRSTPPCGTIAGLYARTDSARGVWKAPAGTDASLVGVQALEYTLTDGQNGILNPLGVNCLRVFPVLGAIAWGARTLVGSDQQASEWKYIPVRRLALFIEESLYRGLQWVVFEPNDEPLWAQIRLNLGVFMNGLFRQGAFQGSTPQEAYFVKCDKETTTQADRNLGIVNIEVGFAPLKPAEFVVITIQQIVGDLS